MFLVILTLLSISLGVGLLLFIFRKNMMYFMTPTEILMKTVPTTTCLRLGGLVQKGSVRHHNGCITFAVTDLKNQIPVQYCGVVPSLFREGQGVVAQGKMDAQGQLQASRVLAKHDEYYRPPSQVEKK